MLKRLAALAVVIVALVVACAFIVRNGRTMAAIVKGGADVSRAPPASIRILYKSGEADGLRIDAEVLAEALHGSTVVAYTKGSRGKRVPMQIWVEHWADGYPGDDEYLLVNHEFLTDWDLRALRTNVTALCKTREAVRVLRELGVLRAIYVGFTSPGLPPQETPWLRFAVHLAGASALKNTVAVIKAALQVPALRSGEAKMVILRREGPTGRIAKELAVWRAARPTSDKLTVGGCTIRVTRVGGIYMCTERVDDVVFAALAHAPVHVCPSAVEGFGHIVNRGRAAGAVVITADAPPMNELVDAKSGILVPAERGLPAASLLPWQHLQRELPIDTYKVDVGALRDAITRALAGETHTLGDCARDRYVRDREAFWIAMNTLQSVAARAPPGTKQICVGEAVIQPDLARPIAATAAYDRVYSFTILAADKYIRPKLERGYLFGKDEVVIACAAAGPESTVIDVGAHIGTFTVPMSRHVARGRVFAFEPQGPIHDLLSRNATANGCSNVMLSRTAVGAAAGEAFLGTSVVEPDGKVEAVSYAPGAQLTNYGAVQFAPTGTRVPIVALDDIDVTGAAVLKVDVEGAENLVFYGARKLIARARPMIIFERNYQTLSPGAAPGPAEARDFDVVEYCAGLGYKVAVELPQQTFVLSPAPISLPRGAYELRPVRSLSISTHGMATYRMVGLWDAVPRKSGH